MAIMQKIRKLFKKSGPSPDVAYVREEPEVPDDSVEQPAGLSEPTGLMDHEIDLTRQTDLEGYARETNLSKASVERWISSGLLMPEELKMAEKLMKILRK